GITILGRSSGLSASGDCLAIKLNASSVSSALTAASTAQPFRLQLDRLLVEHRSKRLFYQVFPNSHSFRYPAWLPWSTIDGDPDYDDAIINERERELPRLLKAAPGCNADQTKSSLHYSLDCLPACLFSLTLLCVALDDDVISSSGVSVDEQTKLEHTVEGLLRAQLWHDARIIMVAASEALTRALIDAGLSFVSVDCLDEAVEMLGRSSFRFCLQVKANTNRKEPLDDALLEGFCIEPLSVPGHQCDSDKIKTEIKTEPEELQSDVTPMFIRPVWTVLSDSPLASNVTLVPVDTNRVFQVRHCRASSNVFANSDEDSWSRFLASSPVLLLRADACLPTNRELEALPYTHLASRADERRRSLRALSKAAENTAMMSTRVNWAEQLSILGQRCLKSRRDVGVFRKLRIAPSRTGAAVELLFAYWPASGRLAQLRPTDSCDCLLSLSNFFLDCCSARDTDTDKSVSGGHGAGGKVGDIADALLRLLARPLLLMPPERRVELSLQSQGGPAVTVARLLHVLAEFLSAPAASGAPVEQLRGLAKLLGVRCERTINRLCGLTLGQAAQDDIGAVLSCLSPSGKARRGIASPLRPTPSTAKPRPRLAVDSSIGPRLEDVRNVMSDYLKERKSNPSGAFKAMLKLRYHDVYYNVNSGSEARELRAAQLQARLVTNETASAFSCRTSCILRLHSRTLAKRRSSLANSSNNSSTIKRPAKKLPLAPCFTEPSSTVAKENSQQQQQQQQQQKQQFDEDAALRSAVFASLASVGLAEDVALAEQLRVLASAVLTSGLFPVATDPSVSPGKRIRDAVAMQLGAVMAMRGQKSA
ncbi:hypothetical protein BOX15_Mlig015001g4, partial [Macrostomum lignano]